MSIENFGGYKPKVKERIEIRERPAIRTTGKVKEEEHLETYGGGQDKR